eukprot:15455828-Alexandrium_andersonii.AAC.1
MARVGPPGAASVRRGPVRGRGRERRGPPRAPSGGRPGGLPLVCEPGRGHMGTRRRQPAAAPAGPAGVA